MFGSLATSFTSKPSATRIRFSTSCGDGAAEKFPANHQDTKTPRVCGMRNFVPWCLGGFPRHSRRAAEVFRSSHARKNLYALFVIVGIANAILAQNSAPLPQTSPLTVTGDLSAQMVEGIDRWLMRETERIAAKRAKQWESDLDGMRIAEKFPQNHPEVRTPDQFQRAKRERLREIIGAVDPIVPNPQFQFIGDEANGGSAEVFRTVGGGGFVAWRVRWPVFEGVFGEGLLLEPLDQNGKVRGCQAVRYRHSGC